MNQSSPTLTLSTRVTPGGAGTYGASAGISGRERVRETSRTRLAVLLVGPADCLGPVAERDLAARHYRLHRARPGADLAPFLRLSQCDLAIVDASRGCRVGLDDIERIRRMAGPAFPILAIATPATGTDRMRELERGANDFVVRPFEGSELGARMRAIRMRFCPSASGDRGHLLPGLELDPVRRVATVDGDEVALGARECALLELLLSRAGDVVTRREIEARLYGADATVESNTVEVYVHHLRRALGKGRIHTVRGVGYLIDSG